MAALPANQKDTANNGGYLPPPYVYIVIIILAIIIVGSPKTYFKTFTGTSDDKVVNYLNVSRSFTLFNYEEIIPALENINETPREKLIEIQQLHATYHEALSALKPPRNFKQFDDILMEVVIRQGKILEEAVYAQEGEVAGFNLLIERNNEANEKLWIALKEALNKSEIPFKELESGIIEYEVVITNPVNQLKYEREQEAFDERWSKLP